MLKDLAIVKLATSVVKKTKEKIVKKREELRVYPDQTIEEAKNESSAKSPQSSNKSEDKTETKVKSSKEKSTKEKGSSTKKVSAKKETQAKKSQSKIEVTTKQSTKKTKTSAKKNTSKSATTQNKKEEKIKKYKSQIQKHYGQVDDKLLEVVVKNLGPSIYRKDAETVSCSDPKELDTVRRNFLQKKLSLSESNEKLDTAIKKVCEELKSSRSKYRATFYYALAKKFNKESALS